ncbi:hypothetical protein [Luteimonas cellulosilyticus]|nr:hypothetical protein [Luteimonas cellulosilyticus]
MVRAILDGCKTQTRRVVKLPEGFDFTAGRGESSDNPANWGGEDEDGMWWALAAGDGVDQVLPCPLGQPGDRLWVRENWLPGYSHDPDHEGGPRVSVIYNADKSERNVQAPSYELAEKWDREFSDDGDAPPPLRPSIHMPRWASRLVLEVTDVRVERLQAISAADCLAEGAVGGHGAIPNYAYNATPREHFEHIWTSTGCDWAANPWVWVVGFRIAEGPTNG